MDRSQLEHAIRAAADVVRHNEFIIIGSQAILGEHPDAPAILRRSIEIDMIPRGRPDLADRIDGALGEDSPFHQSHDFYVQGLTIEAAKLPAGWEERLIVVRGESTRQNTGFCLETHDLAASKLAAYRDKDRDFVRTLMAERLVDAQVLIERVQALAMDQDAVELRVRWIRGVVVALGR
jgi:hypothetical protein